MQKPGLFQYAWKKQLKGRQHLMIPRRYEFADMESLVPPIIMQIEIFKGKIVLIEKQDPPAA